MAATHHNRIAAPGPTGAPSTGVPANNAKGRAWSSIGRRNVGCHGTGLGNGGVRPPSYVRRRGIVTRHPKGRDRFFRINWQRLLNRLLGEGVITKTVHAVGTALVETSDDFARPRAFPQHYIGGRAGVGPRTVNGALRELRRLGLLEWEHRFKYPGHHVRQVLAEANLYEFRLPVELMAEYEIGRQGRRAAQRLRALSADDPDEALRGAREDEAIQAFHVTEAERRRRDRAATLATADAAGRAQAMAAGGTFDGRLAQLLESYVGDAEAAQRGEAAFKEAWLRYRGGEPPPDS